MPAFKSADNEKWNIQPPQKSNSRWLIICIFYRIVGKALETYEKIFVEVEVWEVCVFKCNINTEEDQFDLGCLGVLNCKQH